MGNTPPRVESPKSLAEASGVGSVGLQMLGMVNVEHRMT